MGQVILLSDYRILGTVEEGAFIARVDNFPAIDRWLKSKGFGDLAALWECRPANGSIHFEFGTMCGSLAFSDPICIASVFHNRRKIDHVSRPRPE